MEIHSSQDKYCSNCTIRRLEKVDSSSPVSLFFLLENDEAEAILMQKLALFPEYGMYKKEHKAITKLILNRAKELNPVDMLYKKIPFSLDVCGKRYYSVFIMGHVQWQNLSGTIITEPDKYEIQMTIPGAPAAAMEELYGIDGFLTAFKYLDPNE
ncbi:MAG: hypothetical protein GY765_42110 [bacterium]|nr:hypothetical protein [bacterium]